MIAITERKIWWTGALVVVVVFLMLRSIDYRFEQAEKRIKALENKSQ